MSTPHSSDSKNIDPEIQAPDHKRPYKHSLAKLSIFIVISILATVLILSFLLISTQTGSHLLWRHLNQALPTIEGELVEGSIISGWSINNFRWQNKQLSFYAHNLTFNWHLGKLVARQLPVHLLELTDGTLEIHSVVETNEPKKTKNRNSTINIPLDILIKQINIQDFTLSTPDMNIELNTFKASAHLYNNHLYLSEILSENAVISLRKLDNTATGLSTNTLTKQNRTRMDLSTITLPEIKLPIPISLQQFTLKNTSYQQDQINEVINKLEFSFNWKDTKISNLKLKAKHRKINLMLNGDLQLSGNYPIDLTLNAMVMDNFNIPDLSLIKGETILLETKGNLEQLQVNIDTKGIINASLEGMIAPLSPNIPFNISVTWPMLQWPLDTHTPNFSAYNGSISIMGHLNGYQLTASTLFKRDELAEFLQLNAYGDLKHINFEALSSKRIDKNNPSNQSLTLTGQVDWKQGVHGKIDMQLLQLDTSFWQNNLPGVLNGQLNCNFSIIDDEWAVNIPELSIKGLIRNNPFVLNGKLEANHTRRLNTILPFNVNIDNLHIGMGDNNVIMNGKIDNETSLKTKINAPLLDILTPNLKGSIQGSIELTGSNEQPNIAFNFDSSSLSYKQTKINNLKIKGEWNQSNRQQGTADLSIDSMKVNKFQLNKLVMHASGNKIDHKISLKTDGKEFSGTLLFNGLWNNDLVKNEGVWKGQLITGKLSTPIDNWLLEKPVTILINPSDSVSFSTQCWQANGSKFCVNASQFTLNHGSTQFELTDFNLLNLQPFMPDNITWHALISSQGFIKWSDHYQTARLVVQSTPGKIDSHSDNPFTAQYQTLSAIIELNDENLKTELDFASHDLGNAEIDLNITDMDNQQNLSGQTTIQNMRLPFLHTFIPNINYIDGLISTDTRLDGTLKQPLFYGHLKLHSGEITAKKEIVKIKKLITELYLNGNKGKIDGSMVVDEGQMKLSGKLDWAEQPISGTLQINGDNLGIKIPGILRMKVSPDLKLEIGKTRNLTGTISIPWARMKIKHLPKQAVTPSNDVVIITPETNITKAETNTPLSMSVNVILEEDIKIEAYGLKSDLNGHFLLLLEPGKPIVSDGSLHLIKGSYHQFGQDLSIQEGSIIFSGPLSSPYLTVNAIRNPENIEDNVTVGINVSGPPTRPEISIYSNPEMSEQEKWSYLLRGRGIDNDNDSYAVQSILVGLGVSQFGGVITTIGEKVGISDVTVDTRGSGDNTQITIGGNIAPGLRVAYGAGVFNSISEIKVRYELLPQIYIQAVSGLSQAIDLFYRFKIETGMNKKRKASHW